MTHLSLADQSSNTRGRTELEPFLQYGFPKARMYKGNHAVEQRETGQHGEHYKPKPKEDVDLLVENIQSQNAKCVQLLNRTGSTKFVEGTLGDAWKYFNHRIASLFLIHIAEFYHFGTVLEKSSAEKRIDEEYITNLDDKKKQKK